jgi:hypothetical protein
MILKCKDCGYKMDTNEEEKEVQLIKIGNCWHCIKCRGYKFIIEEIDIK